MKEFKFTITDPMGIHARPAGLLIKLTSQFSSSVSMTKEEKTVDAKRILGVMSLGVKQGQEVVITVEGADEDQAMEAIQKFMTENM